MQRPQIKSLSAAVPAVLFVIVTTFAAKPAVKGADLCRYLIDPYEWIRQKQRFFQAAGPDNILTSKEFTANKAKTGGFARPFDSWTTMSKFDKDRSKSIDWIEAEAYRRDLRKRLLAAFDANSDGRLTGNERAAANKALASGRVPIAKSSRKIKGTPSARRHTSVKHRGHSRERQLYEQRSELKKQFYALSAKLAASPGAANERKAYEDAERAYQNSKKAPAIMAARRPYEAAKAAYEKAREALPEAEAVKKASKAYDDARHNMPEYKARNDAREALGKISRGSSRYAGARNFYEDAEKAYDAKKAALPEYAALRAAGKALDAAEKNLPEYKASEDAEKAYRVAYYKHIAEARKARDEARKARDEKVAELLKTDPAAVSISSQIQQIETKMRELRSRR